MRATAAQRIARAAALALCVACAAPAPKPRAITAAEPTPTGLSELHYTFTLDEGLQKFHVRACMRGDAPTRFVHGTRAAMRYLQTPRVLAAEGDAHQRGTTMLPVLADGFSLQGAGRDACVAYELDFSAAVGETSLYLVHRGDGYLLTAPELLLFRPPQRAKALRATARFVLPKGAQVSISWPQRDGVFELGESAFAFTGHAAFGAMHQAAVQVPGGVVELSVLPGLPEATGAWIAPWIQTAGAVVAGALGTFPAARAQVIVVPTGGNNALRFGHTGRSGGPSVVLFVPADVGLTYLREDWIAIHEFCHLIVPFIRKQDAWLSEGLATYLQDVLRVRAGLLSPQQLWQRFHEGAQYGLAAEGTLAEETKIMPTAGNYQRVYWAGAIITLMLDVELRERTQGRVTLWSVLSALAPLRDGASRPYSAEELLAAMERAASGVSLSPLAMRLAHAKAFPKVDSLYARLGLRSDGQSDAHANAPQAWIAGAITEAAPTTAELTLFQH